jgi:hypothetical protein
MGASFMLLLLFVLMKKQNVVNADVDYFQINTTLLCFPFFFIRTNLERIFCNSIYR